MPTTASGSPGTNGRVGTTIRAPKTAELIAARLRRQIVLGEITPGQTLPPESQLMEQFQVSRPTLREAFRILEAEALISVRRGSRGGAEVIEPQVSVAARYVGLVLQTQGTMISDVYEARMVTEPAAARLLALRKSPESIARLSAIVDELAAELDEREPFVLNPDTWSRLTSDFHQAILQECGNKTLATQGAVLAEIVGTHLRAQLSQGYDAGDQERFRRTIRSYAKFIRLLKAGDADGAEKHWLAHMESAAHYLLNDDLKSTQVVDLFT
ncbi:MAG: FCD domain-containing protein [Nocardioides sp.]|uniref:FadR/GntR family transcriptional regulator n=1 Tax=Nocardioides sp. TaxID=35761 RepID=UPI0039E6E8FA